MKVVFKNLYFYWFVIIFISALLLYNSIYLINNFTLITLLPVIIQIVLLYLIFTKNKNVKIAIKIWIIVFILIGFGLQFLGKFLKFIASDFAEFNPIEILKIILFLIIGFIILIFSNKTIEIK